MAEPRSPRRRTISSSSSLSSPSSPVAPRSGVFEYNIIDAEELFKQNSIEQIKDAENKIKGEIERKKEDLRYMVGERYRDLIDAADTIKDMGHITEQVFKGIVSMQRLCSEFELEGTIRMNKLSMSTEVKMDKEDNFYALATQMELMVDTPEKIWSALDRHEYLMAAQLYLLADHIVNTSLKIKSKRGKKDVFAKFPILHHQWAAISHFKASILKDTKSSLKDVTLPDKDLAESLCSMILLENSSVREAFMEFILSRKSAVTDVFHPSQHTASVKTQVCSVTRLVHLTCLQIFRLFLPTDQLPEASLEQSTIINNTLASVTAGDAPADEGGALQELFEEDFDVLTVARHLPPSVLGFRPKLRSLNLIIPIQNVQNNSNEWLNRCTVEIKTEVSRLLQFVKTVKGLASIRDAVYDLMVNFEENRPEQSSKTWGYQEKTYWSQVSEAVLGEELSIWKQFFREIFLQRIQEIISGEFRRITKVIEHSIDSYMVKLSNADLTEDTESHLKWENDVGSYLWEESKGSLPVVNNVDDRTAFKRSDLLYKAKSQTTCLVRSCTELDNMVKHIIDDVSCYGEETIDNSKSQKIKTKPLSETENIEPFCKAEDSERIYDVCFGCCQRLISDIGKALETKLKHLESELLADLDPVSLTLINRILFLGRFGLCMIGNTPSLKAAMTKKSRKLSVESLAQPKTLERTKSMPKANEELPHEFAELKSFQERAVTIWKTWLLDLIAKIYREMFNNEGLFTAFGSTGWDEVKIQEETETGQPVESTIEIPSQLSFSLSSLLFRVTQEINRIGGQILDRLTMKSLSLGIGHRIIEILTEYVSRCSDETMWQERALQFIFDVKLLTSLITGTSDTKDKELLALRDQSKLLLDKLEQFVDPFDLDVFLPYITSYVTRQLQRSWLLLGVLCAADRHPAQAFGQRLSLSSKEQHSVLPVNPNPVRFILLPVATSSDPFGNQLREGTKTSEQKTAFTSVPLNEYRRLSAF